MENFAVHMEKYAEIAVKIGINIQQNQTLIVSAPIEAVDFVRLVAKKAYEAGAKHVHFEWADDDLTLTRFMLAPEDSFKEFPEWKAKGFEEMAAEGAGFLSIYATNPDLLKDVDPQRVATANKARAQAMKNFSNYVKTSKISWSVISVPTKSWAAKVMAAAPEDKQVELLWDTIFKVTRVYEEDPVQAWDNHIKSLKEKMDFLNEKKFKTLHYQAPGTDLTIELPEGHVWLGGGEKNQRGIFHVANMPTEEAFTMPLKTGVNGTVASTKPLNYGGNLIEDFTLTFQEGKVVSYTAKAGEAYLKQMLELDEGASYLGEVALVPHSSPISTSNLIFYNTLFDENASCHLAIGSAYPTNIEGGADMTEEELKARGVNVSLTHVDFMIGSGELDIDGVTASGERIPVFRKGEWAI